MQTLQFKRWRLMWSYLRPQGARIALARAISLPVGKEQLPRDSWCLRGSRHDRTFRSKHFKQIASEAVRLTFHDRSRHNFNDRKEKTANNVIALAPPPLLLTQLHHQSQRC